MRNRVSHCLHLKQQIVVIGDGLIERSPIAEKPLSSRLDVIWGPLGIRAPFVNPFVSRILIWWKPITMDLAALGRLLAQHVEDEGFFEKCFPGAEDAEERQLGQ